MKVSKGFKQTEIGEIPEDWEIESLVNIGKFLKGSGIKKEESQSGTIPCIRYGEIYTKHHFFVSEFYSFISEDVACTARLIKYGDILFAGSGETKEDIGKCVAFVSNFNAYAGGDIVIYSPDRKRSVSLFLGYLLNSQMIQKQKTNLAQGDTVVHISSSHLSNIKIPLPPLKEQQAIAEVLSDMDRMISQTETLIEKKKAIKQGMMQELLRPKDGWVKKKLGDVCELVNGYAFKSNDYSSFGRYSIVTISNVQDGFLSTNEFSYIDEIPNDIQRHQLLEGGDILISLTGNVGRVCRVSIDNGLLNQRVGKAIPRSINADFLFVLLVNSNFRKLMIQSAVGGAQGNIGKDSINDFEFYLPNDNKEILSISVVSNNLQNEIELLESKLQKLKLQKQGMMQVLLTGRIRLT
jgi:type I restriction enzyme S subunit